MRAIKPADDLRASLTVGEAKRSLQHWFPIGTDGNERQTGGGASAAGKVLFMAASECGEASPAAAAENHSNCQKLALLLEPYLADAFESSVSLQSTESQNQ